MAVEGGARTVVAPSGGRTYDTSGNPQFSACTEGQDGWGGLQDTWAISTWASGDLALDVGAPATA